MRPVLGGIMLFVALGGSACAESSSSQGPVPVAGNVPAFCAVEPPALLADTPAVNVGGLDGATLSIVQLADPATLATNAASVGIGFLAVCNYPHRIVMESQNNGLWRDIATAAPPGFADAVPYAATLTWGGAGGTLQADATSQRIADLTLPVDRAAAGQIALRVQILPGASNAQSFAPLLAGIYRDTIRVTVEPQ